MRRLALIAVVIAVGTAAARSEDMWDPPWDDMGFPETTQEWNFPNLLTFLGYENGDVLDPLLPMSPHPVDMENPFGVPHIEWPFGEIEVEDPENPGGWILLTVRAEVQMIDYTTPDDGLVLLDAPTVHISIEMPNPDPDPQAPPTIPVEGTPLAGTTVPVSIWIPNNPDPNLSKMIFWQMTSDKSPTPTGSPPTATGVGPDTYGSTDHPAPHPHIDHGGGGWYTYNGLVEIQPNPEGEWLTFELVDSTNIEEIVIKTVCMPEPATLGLMALGGLGVLARRRRRR